MKKPRELNFQRKSPFVYDAAKEQHILRVRSGGQCEAIHDWIHGRKGMERCPHKQGERCVAPAKGRVILTVRFMAKRYDYKKALAICFSCNMAWDRMVPKRRRRKKPVISIDQVEMFSRDA